MTIKIILCTIAVITISTFFIIYGLKTDQKN